MFLQFYSETSREIQDRFDSRRLADQLAETRKHDEFNSNDIEIITKAPMLFLATATPHGFPDCSVKGGDPGFVKIIGPDTLMFPDYDGNGMYRSLGNIAANPHVGLLFFELDNERRKLRINGTAHLSDNPEHLSMMPGSKLAVIVKAKDIFPNCPRYLPRLQVQELSVYSPRPNYEPPPPNWKSKPDLKDILPRAQITIEKE